MLSSLNQEEAEEKAQLSGAPEEEPAGSQDTSQHCLWVDEFAPQHYTELLSDDVRSCSWSGVTGYFVAKGREFRMQLMFCCQQAGLSGWMGGLSSASLTCRWGN